MRDDVGAVREPPPHEMPMPNPWPMVSLGELITLQRRPVTIIHEQIYPEIGIYCFGRGIFHKLPRKGFEVGDKDLHLIKEGDFILQVTFAWEGAVALASNAEDGMYGSIRFPTFRVDEGRCFPPYLVNYFRTKGGLDQLIKICPGSAGRNRVLSIKRIPEVMVPLPPLDEQRRIVARIEQFAVKIQEAHELRASSSATVSILAAKATDSALTDGRWPARPLATLLREDSHNGLSARPSQSPPGLPILRISAATSREDGVVDESDFRFLQVNEKEARQYTLRAGDLLACRFNGNLHYVGRFALYTGYSGEKQLYPDKLIRFRVDEQLALPQFVRVAMDSSAVRETVESLAATTAGNLGIAAGTLKTVHLPVPPPQDQRRIVAYLDNLQTKVDALKRLQAETAAELDALLPSILDKAFRGEL